MSFDEELADRIRRVLRPDAEVTERKMFGGLAFMRAGKMFCGVVKDELTVRVGPERYEESLAKAHVRPMDFTGRPMNGYVFVGPSGCRTDEAVKAWVALGAASLATLGDPPPSRRPKRTARRTGRRKTR